MEDFRDVCNIDWELADSITKERVRYAEKLIDYLKGRYPLTASRKDLRGFVSITREDLKEF